MATSPDDVRDLVEEILNTAFALANALTSLLDDLPEDAFPGEEPAEVLIEMLTGTLRPTADAAGEEVVRQTTALLGAARDRVISDLRAAAAAGE